MNKKRDWQGFSTKVIYAAILFVVVWAFLVALNRPAEQPLPGPALEDLCKIVINEKCCSLPAFSNTVYCKNVQIYLPQQTVSKTGETRNLPKAMQCNKVSASKDSINYLEKELNINLKDTKFWSGCDIGKIVPILSKVKSEAPALFSEIRSVGSLEKYVEREIPEVPLNTIVSSSGFVAISDDGGNLYLSKTLLEDSAYAENTVIHEAAHLRDILINPNIKRHELGRPPEEFWKEINQGNGGNFDKKWASISGDVYLKACRVAIVSSRPICIGWNENLDWREANNGLINAYGGTNLAEDIATMTAESYTSPEKVLRASSKDSRIQRKVALLCECKFVEKKDICNNALIMLVPKTGVC